jgi:hypothetical protein
MFRILFVVIVLITLNNTRGIAQVNCEPDETYADSTAGVYPRPVSEQYPDAGIDVIACPGEDYFFTFTINVPDTILLGTTPIAISRVRLRTDTPVTGLPEGISHACEPTNCDMLAGTLGCVALSGTVGSEVESGIYPLVILVELITSFGLAIPTQFPNDQIAPGEYFLTVGEKNDDGECVISSNTESFTNEGLSLFPNPASDRLHVRLDTRQTGNFFWQIWDTRGKLISQGKSDNIKDNLEISLQGIPSGNYRLLISNGTKTYHAPFWVGK